MIDAYLRFIGLQLRSLVYYNRATSHDHKWSQLGPLTPRVDAGCLTSDKVGSHAVFDHVLLLKASWMAAVTNVPLNFQFQILGLIFRHL